MLCIIIFSSLEVGYSAVILLGGAHVILHMRTCVQVWGNRATTRRGGCPAGGQFTGWIRKTICILSQENSSDWASEDKPLTRLPNTYHRGLPALFFSRCSSGHTRAWPLVHLDADDTAMWCNNHIKWILYNAPNVSETLQIKPCYMTELFSSGLWQDLGGVGWRAWGQKSIFGNNKICPLTKAKHWLPVTNEINKIVWFLDTQ